MLLPGSESNAPEAQLLGELDLLTTQLGAPLELAGVAAFPTLNSAAALRDFLEWYRRELLESLELPAIHRAFVHASRNEARELIAFDRELGARLPAEDFSHASRRIGVAQLKRLRPLRDERLVQRYLSAVEAGQAHGWHTLVFGIGLHLYSLPLRQGLIGYAHQTLAGFVHSAAPRLSLTDAAVEKLLAGAMTTLPAAAEKILAENCDVQLRGAPALHS